MGRRRLVLLRRRLSSYEFLYCGVVRRCPTPEAGGAWRRRPLFYSRARNAGCQPAPFPCIKEIHATSTLDPRS